MNRREFVVGAISAAVGAAVTPLQVESRPYLLAIQASSREGAQRDAVVAINRSIDDAVLDCLTRDYWDAFRDWETLKGLHEAQAIS